MEIKLINVEKKFKDNVILRDINATFKSGKIYGFVGRNGSGKSVLLKMICSFYNTTGGEILFDGINIEKEHCFPPNTRALIENPNFIPDLTGYENLELLASIQGRIGECEILKAMDSVNLTKDKDKKYSKYSLGMKQKLGIAQVIMENPDIMILDEPFNGIEEKTAEDLRKLLRDFADNGKLIIVASHIKEDIELLCDIIYKFDDGKMKLIEK